MTRGTFKPRARRRLIPGARCAYCAASGATTLDHVVPKSRGGRGTISNAVPACSPCNGVKGSYPVEVFRAWLLTPAGAQWAGVAPALRSVGQGVRLFVEHMRGNAERRRAARKIHPRLEVVPPEEALPSLVGGRDDYEGLDR